MPAADTSIWCANATLLTAVPWSYTKIPETELKKLAASELAELAVEGLAVAGAVEMPEDVVERPVLEQHHDQMAERSSGCSRSGYFDAQGAGTPPSSSERHTIRNG